MTVARRPDLQTTLEELAHPDGLTGASPDRITVLSPGLTILYANRVALPTSCGSVAGAKCYSVFAAGNSRCVDCPAFASWHERAPARAAPDAQCAPVASRPMVGGSAAMQQVHRLVARAARAPSNVLVTGESGTGKELVALAIHERSARASRPFLPVNVSAIPRELVESHLFGHERGAFTGADRARPGALRAAEGGTVFLDEIGELPVELQAKLLRAIEEKEAYPVGTDTPVKVDVRIVAATHRDLAAMVTAERFRRDLYFRLNVVRIHVPALRERIEDVPALVEHILDRCARELALPPPTVEPDAMRLLLNHPWSGNVRELSNVIERAAVLGDGVAIRVADLEPELGTAPAEDELEEATVAFQRRHIARVLAEVGGHRETAARRLGISEATLYRKLVACGLKACREGPCGS